MKHVLIASPVKQKPAILQEFLTCLAALDQTNLRLEYVFIDDHELPSPALQQFAQTVPDVAILHGNSKSQLYHCTEKTHCWQEDIVWKVAGYKDYFIQLAREKAVDFLFLVDSDLALHPQTITHLTSLNQAIVSEVYWTKWEPAFPPLPQVWAGGQYRLHEAESEKALNPEQVALGQQLFLSKLHCPGLYKVGGLGACTLINKTALESGISFSKIYNLDLTGEDRHFCVRAAVLGLELHADTCYPPYHIYRESELPGLSAHKLKYDYAQTKPKPRLTLAMVVRNEAGRYLEKVLLHAARYIDQAVILDDASTDETVEICRRCLAPIPHQIISNPESGFHNEIALRKQLWNLAGATQPDWILVLDADEVFDDEIMTVLPHLLANPDAGSYSFRLYDMWSETCYREDNYWQAHKHYRPFLVRYLPDQEYTWQETPLHCGRLPLNTGIWQEICCQVRLQHWGWSRPADRLKKYYRYKELDPLAAYGIKEQYLSILDPRPNLVRWHFYLEGKSQIVAKNPL